MELLISIYDNALIYYPNIFFVALFFIGILGIILAGMGIIILWKKIKRVIQKIKNDLKQIKRRERKIFFVPMVRVFFERKKLSFVYTIRASAVFFIHIVRVAFIRMNTALGYIDSQTERIIKKIEKEIFVKE